MIKLKKITNNCLILFALFSVNVAAEQETGQIKPLQTVHDINSVDLLTGKYYPSLPQLNIPAAPNLSFETIQKLTSKISGTLYRSRNDSERTESYSLTYGGSTSESFTCKSYDCVPTIDTGSVLVANMSSGSFTYMQGKTGMLIRYDSESSYVDLSNVYGANNRNATGTWHASEIIFPDGEVLSLTYDKVTEPDISP